MHLLYLDDSGAVADASQQYFVLAGFSIFERQGYWISQELDRIASSFDPQDPGSIEFHGSPMLQGTKGWRRFPLPDRVRAFSDALRFLAGSHSSNRIFGVAVRKAAIAPRDPVEYAFEQLCSRFDQYLMRLHRADDTQRGMARPR
ncbi:MAG: DUF3800 domain-containing protein [Pseudomonadota bacterium]